MKSIEYSFLDRTTTIAAMEQFCNDAKERNATTITVPSMFIKKVKERLHGSPVKISTVIGYPFGWSPIEAKVAEAILAMVDGADELEIVVNIIALKNNDWQYLAKELNTLLAIIRKQQKQVCFVIEAKLLTAEELTRCCDLYGVAGIDCIALSTGLEKELPSIEMIKAGRRQLAERVAIKITGENISETTAQAYLAAGASRIGVFVK
ncbi:MAG: 2-deoxyribose-5-phosphate aldolase [Rhizobacter sp.]|nr:2-deoxyribose-5-phosphate aldolase [Ferruginibacter sp.]